MNVFQLLKSLQRRNAIGETVGIYILVVWLSITFTQRFFFLKSRDDKQSSRHTRATAAVRTITLRSRIRLHLVRRIPRSDCSSTLRSAHHQHLGAVDYRHAMEITQRKRIFSLVRAARLSRPLRRICVKDRHLSLRTPPRGPDRLRDHPRIEIPLTGTSYLIWSIVAVAFAGGIAAGTLQRPPPSRSVRRLGCRRRSCDIPARL
jgi:hypothetical protein